jgi:hypothetical protein
MSFVTGTVNELLWANTTSGTALASFTTEASMAAGIVNLGTTAGNIQAGMPAGFYSYQPGGGVGKVVRVHLGGVFSSAAGTATFTFGLRWTSAAGVLIATTTAITPATLTNAIWDSDIDIILTAAGPTTTATARATGVIHLENSVLATGTTITTAFCTGSAFGTPTPTSLTTAGFDSTVALPIVPTVACSASSASNAVTLNDFKIYGLN